MVCNCIFINLLLVTELVRANRIISSIVYLIYFIYLLCSGRNWITKAPSNLSLGLSISRNSSTYEKEFNLAYCIVQLLAFNGLNYITISLCPSSQPVMHISIQLLEKHIVNITIEDGCTPQIPSVGYSYIIGHHVQIEDVYIELFIDQIHIINQIHIIIINLPSCSYQSYD